MFPRFPLSNLEFTMDSIYEQLLERLNNDNKIQSVSRDLLKIKDSAERVLYIHNILKNNKLIPFLIKVDKCEFMSTHYRNLGNQYYQRAELYKAWQLYNLSLMYSPLLNMTYSLAVANRSAVFAELKKYNECLDDIKIVFSMQYPEKLRDKLLKRKIICEEALKEIKKHPDLDQENKDIEEILTLKGPRNDVYVSASSKLEVKYSEEMGRHVVAKEDIEVGQIIVEEDPFVKVLLKPQYVFTCAYCFSRKSNLYPCPHCCLTMYCSKSCETSAWAEYHSYECLLIANLVKMKCTKLELLALRTTIKAKTNQKDLSCLFSTILDAESKINSNNWGQVKVGDKWVYDSKYYASIHTLATNIQARNISDIFQKCVSAAVLLNCLSMVNFINSDNNEIKDKMKQFTAATLLRHMMTAPTNMHGISANFENDDGNFIAEYNLGSAAYAFLSLINHSCSPNVVRYTKLGSVKMYLLALRPIKKGMQVFDNYGAHHAIDTKENRQSALKSQYKFTCVCEACCDDWPTYQNLSEVANLPLDIVNKRNQFLNGEVIEALQKADRKRALELFQPLCDLATALDPYIPCKEAAECQEALKQCIFILTGVVPHGYSNFIEYEIPPPHIEGMPETSRLYIGQEAQDLL